MRLRYLPSLLLLTAASPALAQQPPAATSQLAGTLTNAVTGQPVPYAAVAVLGATGQPVAGGTAGPDGRFTLAGLPAGIYALQASALGYQPLHRPGVAVPAGATLALGPLPLQPAPQQLADVTVTARRPLVEELVDRTVYHAENDQTTRGGDATDVLRRAPLLSVDLDGNVRLRGSQNVKILLNGKPSALTANGSADALKQLPAEQISRVEVITAPSARYDAEGTAGVINIVTKAGLLQGGQLSAYGSGGTRSATLGLNGGYRRGQLGVALGGFGRAGYNTPGSFTNEQQTLDAAGRPTRTTQAAATRQHQLAGRYTLDVDYDLAARHALAASLSYATRNATTYQDALATSTVAPGGTSTSLRHVQATDQSGTVDASLTYTHPYQRPQRELSALALLSYNRRTYAFASDTYAATDAAALGPAGNDNPSTNLELTAQLDYQTPTAENQLLEVGAKHIQRTVASDYAYAGQLAATQVASSLTYRQAVRAAYAAYTLPLPLRLTLKPGLRYEYTSLAADFGAGPGGSLPGYGVLAPSLSALHKLPNGNVLRLSYNRRLQRPALVFLNPNRQAANPLLQTQGNPLLRPELTSNYELGYSTLLRQVSLSLSVFGRNTTGSIQSVRTPLGEAAYPGAVLIGYQNIGRENAYGASAYASYSVGRPLSVSGGLDLYYAHLRNDVPDPALAASSQGLVVGGRLAGSYTLPKGWVAQFFGFYQGRQVLTQGTQGGYATYSASVRREFAQERASLGLGAENFFTPRTAVHTELSAPLLAQQSDTVQHLTSFKVYFSYSVGKLTAEARPHRSIRNDDLKETENGGGSQGSGSTPAATRPAPAKPAAPAKQP